MSKSSERLLAFIFGVVFVVALLVIAFLYPNPSAFQYTVFRIVLALAAGGVASMIPGFLSVQVANWLRAGGALAVFAIVYFYSPAQLVATSEEQEIEKPIVTGGGAPLGSQGFIDVAYASEPIPSLTVASADALTQPGILEARYGTVTVDKVRATVPRGSTLVANDVVGINGGSLTGTGFSIVARRLANLTVDSGGEPNSSAGSIRLYVKTVQNSRLVARGADGTAGKNGLPGASGTNGADGRNGRCDGFGGYRGADAGGDAGNGKNGEDGQPGGNGQPGGFILLTTIAVPVDTVVDVMGGAAGPGGAGGAGGLPGRPGRGGLGCTGLGGSQPNQNGGRDGLPGTTGQNGKPGAPGAKGEYRLVIIRSFDAIVARIKAVANAKLNDALQLP